jgi:hypothetical protein
MKKHKKIKVERPKRFRFKLSSDKKSDSYLDFVLDENDDLRNARFVYISKASPTQKV